MTNLIFNVVTSGRHGFRFVKHGGKRATRTYRTGNDMRDDVAFYLFNRDCTVFVHKQDGTVERVITAVRTSQEQG